MSQSLGQAKIAEAIVDLAHHLGMNVIAEGVETAEQLKTLKGWGCEYAQGYWIARPTDQDSIEALLATSPLNSYRKSEEISIENC